MILLIAYGNSLRRDDGAGLILAEKLEQDWLARQIEVERIEVQQLTPELVLEIARDKVAGVVFADTRVVSLDEIAPGLQMRQVHPVSPSSSLGHHLDPSALLAYAHLLYGQRPPAWIVTVPGVDFDHGEGLSQVAQQAIAEVSKLSAGLLAKLFHNPNFL